jgi:hypothetical protein
VLGLVVGLLGGWERTTPDGVRDVEPGEEVVVAPLRVRLDRAEASYEVGGRPAELGRAYVVVAGTLTTDRRESVSSEVVTDAIRADLTSTYSPFGSPSDEAVPTVLVAEDGSSLLGMGPGLTYAVLLVYDIDEAAVPDEMAVVLQEHKRRRSFIDGTLGWFDPEPAAEVALSVAPLPDERPPEEGIL